MVNRIILISCLLGLLSPLNALTNQTTNDLSPPASQTSDGFSPARYFKLGGVFMYPLLLLAAAGLALISERLIHGLGRRRGQERFVKALLFTLEKAQDPLETCRAHPQVRLARLFTRALEEQEKASLSEGAFLKRVTSLAGLEVAERERNLGLIASVANLAPLIGFLGTVTGMIAAFGSIAEADSVSARIVSAGIFEALITTAAGLIIAIPAFAFHNYSVHRIDRFIALVEKIANRLAQGLKDEAR